MNSTIKILLIICLLGLIAFVVLKIMSKFKTPKLGQTALVSGGVKTGKSTFAVHLAKTNYDRIHRRWKIRSYFQNAFGKKVDEEPLFYSNIPMGFPYVKLTKDLLTRKKRFAYGSVIFVDEASLVADNTCYKDDDINERLLLFNKLIGHELHGNGLLVYNSHCISDLSIQIRKCVSEYYYVHHTTKWIPGVLVAEVREERYSEDGSVINNYADDVEESLKRVLMRKKTWKYFDSCAFSYLTDDLPVDSQLINNNTSSDLKCRELISFRDFKSLSDKNIKIIKLDEVPLKVEDPCKKEK